MVTRLFEDEWGMYSLLDITAYSLMAAALFSEVYHLLVAGAGICALLELISAVRLATFVQGIELLYLIQDLLMAMAYVAVLLAAIRRYMATKWCLLASALMVTGLILGSVVSVIQYDGFMSRIESMFYYVRSQVLSVVMPIPLVGFSMQAGAKEKTVPISAHVQAAAPVQTSASTHVYSAPTAADGSEIAGKLAELNYLVNNGIITQGEYVAKRREILGL